MTNTGGTVVMRAAIYARFSTDKQSENSIADQIRVCERLAERCGFEVVERFSDAAVSGGTAYRAGYQRLLEAARHRVIDVIVAEDISRLWRLLAEQAPRLAELRRVVWNRFRWVRSASDSSRRRAVLNSSSEWIVHTDERLRIVPQELWDRVKARQRARSEDPGLAC